MKIDLNFDHAGWAVPSINEALPAFMLLGYQSRGVTQDPKRKVRICFLEHEKAPRVELIEPMSPDSPVTNLLKKHGASPYHFCFITQKTWDELKPVFAKEGFTPISPIDHAPALGGDKVLFLFSRKIGIIEIRFVQ